MGVNATSQQRESSKMYLSVISTCPYMHASACSNQNCTHDMISILLIFSVARVELTPAEVEEGGFTTACAVYSGFEGPTELLLLTIGAASANPVERYGKARL